MSLSAGTITVNTDGTYTGTGLAKALMDAIYPIRVAGLPDSLMSNPIAVAAGDGSLSLSTTSTMKSAIASSIAQEMQAMASAIITYFTANAAISLSGCNAHVTTQQLGLTPNPNNPSTAIQAPLSPVDIPLTGTGVLS